MLTHYEYLITLKHISVRKGKISAAFLLFADFQLGVGA